MNNNLQKYLTDRYTADTAKAYEREIQIYLGNNPDAQKALYKDLLRYIGVLRNRYKNTKTLNRIVCSIKAYYDYLCSIGQREDNPARSIRLRDKQNRDIQLQDLFSPEELEFFLNRKERYNNLEWRNKVLISLMIYQALHPKELECLTLQDINLQQGTIYIRSTPRCNSRELSLKTTQIMLFYRYIQEIRPKLLKENKNDILLIGHRGEAMKSEDITKHIRRSFAGMYKGRKVNAQTIRQSVIRNLLKEGNDLRVVQVFAGHKYPGTTEKYKQSNVEELKTAVNQYHPIR